jgi:hypothetical protein
MTRKSDTKESTAMLLVYGLDEAGKPRGARFTATDLETVAPVIAALKLESFQPCSDEVTSLGMKLPVGRVYARGKANIPNIKRELYDKLLAAATSANPPGANQPAAAEADSSANASTALSAILPPLASGLPQNWESIATGNMVLADEGGDEGWWPAIVIARDDEILTLRYRDYPKAPKFQRHLSTIALINPRPA